MSNNANVSRYKGGPKSVKSGFSTATTEVAFSNYHYPNPEKEEEARFLKIRGKPGIHKRNLVVIPCITMFLMLSGVDVLQTAAQMLSNPNSYDLGKDEAASVNTNSMRDAMLASCIVLLFGGMLYDLMGRKITVAIFYLIGAVSCIGFPYGKNLSWKIAFYTIMKIIF